MAVLPTARLQETCLNSLRDTFDCWDWPFIAMQLATVLRPDPVPDLKLQLAKALLESLRGMTATESLHAIGLDPSRRSDLRHGRLERFSIAQLIRLLGRCRITVSITTERERP